MKHILIILCLAGGTLKGFSQDTSQQAQHYNFSISECVDYAYTHQDSVVNASLDTKSAEFKVKQTIGQGLPQVSGTANFQDYLKTPTFIIGGQKFSIYQPYNTSAAINVSQLLFDGSYFVGLKAAKTYRELSQRNLTRSKIDVKVNVIKAYYQVLVSNEQLRLLDANVKELKEQLDQTIQQNKQGFVEKIDVDRLTVQYNSVVSNRENVVRSLVLNYQVLKFQMGMPIEYDLTLKESLEDVKLGDNIDDFNGDTSFYKKRIEYGLTQTNLELNRYDLKRQKSYLLPTLSFNASSSEQFQSTKLGSLFNTSYPSTYIGLTLNVPIFSGLQKKNQIKQSEITVLKSQNDLSNLKNALNLQASQARIGYVNGLKTLNVQKQNQILAQEVLRVSKIKYQQGVGSSIEVTQAEASLEDANNKYIQGLYDALISKVDLDKAYGRIQ